MQLIRVLDRALDFAWRNGLERLTRYRWGDRMYGAVAFWLARGTFPSRRPRTCCEHVVRLKMSSEILDPLRQLVTDKEYVRDYITALMGKDYVVPAIAFLRSPAEVEAYEFPARCVIKPTHSSGRYILRRHAFDPVDRETIRNWFAHDYYPVAREANYRHLRPKVIVEEVLSFGRKLPDDYKIHCFSGRPRLIHVLSNRFLGKPTGSIYSPFWERLPFIINAPPGPDVLRPRNLERIVEIAARLSAPFSYVRVDLYTDGQRVYVGELTNIPGGGLMRFDPPEADALTGAFFADPDLEPRKVYAPLNGMRMAAE